MTTKRKLEIYQAALRYIQSEIKITGNYYYGLCTAIGHSIRQDEPDPVDSLSQNPRYQYYPEIVKYQPKEWADCIHWWIYDDNGDKMRIKALKSAIRDIKNDIKKSKNRKK